MVPQDEIPMQYLREASRWSTIASQESNKVLALMHSNYAILCLNVARNISTDKQLHAISGANIAELANQCQTLQDNIARDLIAACPAMRPDMELASASGWV